MLKTSVVICTYNGQKYLSEQLNSVAAQDLPPDEVIISDDASKDASWRIIEDFKVSNPNLLIRTFQNPQNLGFVENFSKASSIANNDIIFFCDQDDLWAPDKVSSTIKAFEETPALTCIHTNAEIVDANLSPLNKKLFDELKIDCHEFNMMKSHRYFELLAKRNVVTGATMAVRRDQLLLSLPIPPMWIHDEWIPMVNSIIGMNGFIDRPLIKYRLHETNTIGLGSSDKNLKLLFDRHSVKLYYTHKISKLSKLLNFEHLDTKKRDHLLNHIAHLKFRLDILLLPRIHRVRPIVSEYMKGCYKCYGRGATSALRDLLSS